MRKLTIGLVSPYSFHIHGGVQKHTINLGRGLSSLGCRVIYLSPDSSSPKLPQPHISIGTSLRVPTPNGSWAEISVAQHSHAQIKQITKAYNIDLLHFQEILAPASTWKWLKSSTVPTLVTFHAGWNNPLTSKSFHSILKTIEPLIKPYITKSLSSSIISEECNFNLLVNNTIVPPAINTQTIKTKNAHHSLYNRPGHHVLFVGRFDIRKGAAYLIKALHLLIPKLTIYLHIIGSGPEKAKLRKLIDSYNLSPFVVFHNHCDDTSKAMHLQSAEAFIAPSTHGESFGMVLVEALSAGCPVIAGNNSGYADTLKDYPYQQYIVDPKDPKKLADAITSLLTNNKHQQDIKKWAKTFVPQFSPEKIAKKHLEIYEQVLANQKPNAMIDKKHGISYYDHGDKSKSTLVVLHGHRSDGKRMLPLSQALSVHNRVLTPNLPGSGDSPCLTENSIDNIAKVTATWLNSLKLKEYSLVGLSMGGMVSIRMLKYLNNKPSHLYLYGTPTNSNELTPNKVQIGIMLMLQKWQYGTKLATKTAETITKNTQIMKALYRAWHPFMDPAIRDFEIDQWRSQQPKSLIETIHDIITHPLSDEPVSQIPTTYILARHDNYLNSKLVKKHVIKILPNTKFVTIKLNIHVPKGPLTSSFFQPFLDTILKSKTLTTNAQNKKA